MKKRYNILIAEDHAMLRESLVRNFARIRFIDKIGEAANGLEVIAQLDNGWDLILLDIRMEPMDGFDVLKRLAANQNPIPVVAISSEPFYEEMAYSLGAKAFLDKICSFDILRDIIKDVLNGEVYAPSKQTADSPAKNQVLRALDVAVLRFICQEKSNKEIAVKLGVTPPTLDYILKKLREKTGCTNNVGLSLYAVKNGYYQMA